MAWVMLRNDSRGHKLEVYEMLDNLVWGDDPDREVYGVAVRAHGHVAEVVPQAFIGRAGVLDSVTGSKYTHAWWFDDGREEVEKLCSMLSEVLTLTPTPELDVAIAGDFYKVPEEGVPADLWDNSEFGQRQIAMLLRTPISVAVPIGSRSGEAKAGRTSYALEPYRIEDDLTGQHVVIVDDVCRSGVTLRSVAEAARDAGATTVCAVVGARTLRKQ